MYTHVYNGSFCTPVTNENPKFLDTPYHPYGKIWGQGALGVEAPLQNFTMCKVRDCSTHFYAVTFTGMKRQKEKKNQLMFSKE